MNTGLIIGLLLPLAGTMLGSALVFFMKKEMNPLLRVCSLALCCN